MRTYENDDEYEEFLWLKLWPFRSLGVIHEFFNETRFLIWDVRRDIVHIDIAWLVPSCLVDIDTLEGRRRQRMELERYQAINTALHYHVYASLDLTGDSELKDQRALQAHVARETFIR